MSLCLYLVDVADVRVPEDRCLDHVSPVDENPRVHIALVSHNSIDQVSPNGREINFDVPSPCEVPSIPT